MKTKWLRHPEYPALRVLVCRSWLGWIFKNKEYATRAEVEYYLTWCAANRKWAYVS